MSVSSQSAKFPASLESFQRVWEVYMKSGKFPAEWTDSEQSGKFLDSVNMCSMINMACKQMQFIHIYVAKAIYALLAHFCHESDLRALSGKFLLVIFCRLESFDFLCLWGQRLFEQKLQKWYCSAYIREGFQKTKRKFRMVFSWGGGVLRAINVFWKMICLKTI